MTGNYTYSSRQSWTVSMARVVCSTCGNYEYGNLRTDRDIVCGACVQALLGYFVIVRAREEYPFLRLRTYLRAKRELNGSGGRV